MVTQEGPSLPFSGPALTAWELALGSGAGKAQGFPTVRAQAPAGGRFYRWAAWLGKAFGRQIKEKT